MSIAQKLLLDEMLTGDIAAQLRARSHDVIAVVGDPALVGTADLELLVYATTAGRCLVTANVRDFASISASWSSGGPSPAGLISHAGLIYIVNRVFPSDRAFVGAIVTALGHAMASNLVPSPGAESYRRRQGGRAD